MRTQLFGVLAFALGALAQTTESLAPSPTESIGCEPHGDHWHCDGPVATMTGTDLPAETEEHDHEHEEGEDHEHEESEDHEHEESEDHEHEAGATEALAPSPTASIGCEPHGDHWHCDGPRETSAAASDESDEATETEEEGEEPTGAAGALVAPLAGLVGAMMFAL